jgi:hypothetical protein
VYGGIIMCVEIIRCAKIGWFLNFLPPKLNILLHHQKIRWNWNLDAILSVFSTLPEKYNSKWKIKLIIRFSLKNWVIYSNIRILHDDWNAVWWVGRLLVGNWQGSAGITTNAILVLFSILSKNHKSNERMEMIIGFSLKNWVIYSNISIIDDD